MDRFIEYYNQYDEHQRLGVPFGELEFVRTQALLRRFLPKPPASVLDVGGASGRYSCWLAQEGYSVHLIDPVERHVEQAQAAAAALGDQAFPCSIGDARALPVVDNAVDAVLLMGPLYHLLDRGERRAALREARRVLKPGGVMAGTAISRFASTIDGLYEGFFLEPAFREIMLRDLADGQHRNPTANLAFFTDTYFHHPDELRAETGDAGFTGVRLYAIEGIGYMMKEFDRNWGDPQMRELLLDIIEKTETDQTLLGASPHIMCVAAK